MALKIASLRRGLLAGQSIVQLVGVGTSLERWRHALERGGLRVEAHAIGRPSGPGIAALARPALLVFTAHPARERWRRALIRSDMRELDDFVFVT